MQIAIGTVPRDDPFGGGNQFSKALSNALWDAGHEVFYDLNNPNLDIVLITEPRFWLQASAFGPLEVAHYLRVVNPKAIVVHRINECDLRKGTKSVNSQLTLANGIADYTVYISDWLRDVFRPYHLTKRHSVIKNGADKKIFKFKLKEAPGKGEKVRIVTHHWSPHWNKGWDIYKLLDESINPVLYEFHYIGNKPSKIETKNIIFHAPCANNELSTLLSSNHIYLTASLYEPAGMHHIEAASVGLPLVFRRSGALPEYCTGYGEGFSDTTSVWKAIKKVRNNFAEYAGKMQAYPADSRKMANEYLVLFEHLISERSQILSERNLPASMLSNWARTVKYYSYYLKHHIGRQ